MWYSNGEIHSTFEFDSKTGDMVLRLGTNSTRFDDFRAKLEGGDMELEKKEYKEKEYLDLVSYEPETNEDLAGYRGEYHPDRYRYGETAKEKEIRKSKHKILNFSITQRANAKKKFKFFSSWEAIENKVWKAEPTSLNPRAGRWIKPEDEDFPEDKEDFTVHKKTEQDHRWTSRVFRSGNVYF